MYNRSELERRLKDLERTVRCKTRFFDSFEDFPETGVECALYVDESTGDIYVWNGSTFIKNESSGGGSELQALTDVDITAPVTEGAILQYDTATSTWKNSTSSGITGTGTSGQVSYWTGTGTQGGSNNLFWDAANNRLGVGTNAPSFNLHVETNANSARGIYTINSNTGASAYSFLSTANSSGNFDLRNYSTGHSTWANIAMLVASSGMTGGMVHLVSANAPIQFYTANSERMRIFGGGNISIGTNSDLSARLGIRGTGTTSATTALLVQNATPTNLLQVLDNGRINQTLEGSGDSTAFGTDALKIATGLFNVAFGRSAGLNTTTGASNTFLGNLSGRDNTTGEHNTFLGRASSMLTTTGSRNTSVGQDSGFSNTTGSDNLFFGYRAGRYITGGSTANTISNNSIFIGYDTRANADNETNQVVIGYQTTGLGSNTTIIGNTSTTQTHLYGNLTLGTTTSGGRLTVQGSGATGSTTALLVQNSTPTNLLQVLDNGRINQNLEGSGSSTAFGTDALRVATGGDNVGIGTSAGFSNSTGNSNVYVGRSSGTFNTTGSNNIFLGRNSGRFISDSVTANTISNNSIFIGNNTQAAADNQTNQIVIGYLTTGLGSNTTVLGGPSTGQTHLYGNLTLGTTTSGGRLTVRGSGTTSATTALLVQNSTPSNLLSITDNGQVNVTPTTLTGSEATSAIDIQQTWNTTGNPSLIYGNVTNTASGNLSLLLDLRVNNVRTFEVYRNGTISISNSISIQSVSGTFRLRSGIGSGSNNDFDFTNAQLGIYRNHTSGTSTILFTEIGYAPTSGTGGFIGFQYNGTINQTGGANGITRGLYVNPNLTSAADWRGVEIITPSNSTIYAGRNTGSAALQIDSTTQGILFPRMTTTERDLIVSPAAGLVIFNITTAKLECYDGAAWQAAW